MFPNVPLQAITLDLADTHSVSLTVERIINDVIYIPDQRVEGNPSQAPPLTPSQVPPSQISPPPPTHAKLPDQELLCMPSHTSQPSPHQPPPNSQPINPTVTTSTTPPVTNSSNLKPPLGSPSQELLIEQSSSSHISNTDTLRRRKVNGQTRLPEHELEGNETLSEEAEVESSEEVEPVGPVAGVANPSDGPITLDSRVSAASHSLIGAKDADSLTSFASLLERKEQLLERARR